MSDDKSKPRPTGWGGPRKPVGNAEQRGSMDTKRPPVIRPPKQEPKPKPKKK